jgi:hypothetical protein
MSFRLTVGFQVYTGSRPTQSFTGFGPRDVLAFFFQCAIRRLVVATILLAAKLFIYELIDFALLYSRQLFNL